MRKGVRKILLALAWGAGGYAGGYIVINSLFEAGAGLMALVFGQIYLPVAILIALDDLLILFANSLVEEGIRLWIIKKWQIFNPYALLLGFSWAATENTINLLQYADGLPLLHISNMLHVGNAVIIAYFVKRNNPGLGFALAFTLHLLWNWFFLTEVI